MVEGKQPRPVCTIDEQHHTLVVAGSCAHKRAAMRLFGLERPAICPPNPVPFRLPNYLPGGTATHTARNIS